MSFIEQTSKIFGNLAETKFHAALYGRDALYLEGVKPIRLDGCSMLFRTMRCIIEVTGEGLNIKEIASDCVSIVGRIDGIAVKDL